MQRLSALFLVSISLTTGCTNPAPVVGPAPAPNYARPLGPGESALRLVTDPAQRPNLAQLADQLADPAFRQSLNRSVTWYNIPSSQRTFPISGISHIHAQTSALAMLSIIENAASPQEAAAQINAQFDVFKSVGWNGQGDVLLTGYFSPEFDASLEKTAAYSFPLYTRPSDLVTDPLTGDVLGQRTDQGTQPYPTRSAIEQGGLLAGSELVYLPSRLDAYTIEVNGSAKLNMTDGLTMYIGYDGNNGYPYTSIGRQLVKDGQLDANTVTMPAIRQFFRDNPAELERYIQRNDRFIFFSEYDDTDWPAGSLGFRVEGGRSMATDKEVYPPGAVVLVQSIGPNRSGAVAPINRLVLDQDTGGAIRAPGRADLYFGIGDGAEHEAGVLAIEANLYYLFLKRDNVQQWHDQLN